jgi:hypothetical protein
MSILLDSDDRRRHGLDYAKHLLMHFVEMSKSVYGDTFTMYGAFGKFSDPLTFHILLHYSLILKCIK